MKKDRATVEENSRENLKQRYSREEFLMPKLPNINVNIENLEIQEGQSPIVERSTF